MFPINIAAHGVKKYIHVVARYWLRVFLLSKLIEKIKKTKKTETVQIKIYFSMKKFRSLKDKYINDPVIDSAIIKLVGNANDVIRNKINRKTGKMKNEMEEKIKGKNIILSNEYLFI